MQTEKKVTLAGPYGALANATELPTAPQFAGLLFEPNVLTQNNEARFEPVPRPAAVVAAPLPPPAVVASAPPSEMRTPPQARNGSFTLPDVDSRTAVYDISARTVYLPGGRRLEAHSGLGDKMDNPRYVGVKNRGPTPPNVYDLSLRERPFHGVRAIRLTPVDDDKMFGRDGILAHSYMLGRSGQSNGCVSFSDYPAFLRAYMKGEVERMVVVERLPKSASPALMSMRQGNARAATNNF